eukprot:TRINITY_DN29734_c0_g1_i1.p1 TRINITY_DN29734_c0_g1~~TRINITY_DN29734_c0_g1_i1.p1  ORF type:complete len:239 (-),score=28.62 TRINITY_DN29734_c0_g1_i1:104-784(-)
MSRVLHCFRTDAEPSRLWCGSVLLAWLCSASCFCVTSSYRIKDQRGASPITKQIVMTAKQGTLNDLPANIQANVRRNLALDQGLKLRWLTDADCTAYLQEHYDAELLRLFKKEEKGMLRGDICRAAVLAREGGFYMDLDLQLNSPLSQLIDDTTTFASAFSMDGFVLNAILAVKPGCPVMKESLEFTKKWYSNEIPHADISMGTETIFRALKSVVDRDCNADMFYY